MSKFNASQVNIAFGAHLWNLRNKHKMGTLTAPEFDQRVEELSILNQARHYLIGSNGKLPVKKAENLSRLTGTAVFLKSAFSRDDVDFLNPSPRVALELLKEIPDLTVVVLRSSFVPIADFARVLKEFIPSVELWEVTHNPGKDRELKDSSFKRIAVNNKEVARARDLFGEDLKELDTGKETFAMLAGLMALNLYPDDQVAVVV